MELIDYIRTLKTLTILLLLFFMNFVPNQKGKILEETLAGSNSDFVKTTLRRLRYFKMPFFLLQVLQKFLPNPLSRFRIQ